MVLGARGEFWFFREFIAFFVFCEDEDEQTFSFLQVHITRADKLLCVRVYAIKTEVTEICTCGWRVILWGNVVAAAHPQTSMLSEGYLISDLSKPRKNQIWVRFLSRGKLRVSVLSTCESMRLASVLRSPR